MKFVPNGSIIKFLLIAVLGCGLAFLMAWLTTMFTVIKRMSGMFFDFKRCGNLVP